MTPLPDDAVAATIVLLAHGSPDPRHAHGIEALAARVAVLDPGREVRIAYLDHHGPTPGHIGHVLSVAGADRDVVVVPALLSRAFHVEVDVPDAAAALATAYGRRVLLADALGPDAAIGEAIGELLRRDRPSADVVVVYVAGSSRRAAVDELLAAIAAGVPPGPHYAFATLDDYKPLDDAVGHLNGGAQVVGVSAMLAEGVLRDRMVARCRADGIPFVGGVLGDTDAVARLVLARAAAAR
ncbi:MAG TPA: CbiX/SirB N-terminal domain-containing protein [Tetrasphaera sp.]|uniref:sirohydrochlorin chelatase n=1 Tax=Nostocoides sp. TaxID=1917966 RepID=UPI002BC3893B|nr:CbiX/SirB N-terminal domain-containing protein [Tetrasphaera sp.]HNQ08083.1 CbiX/SirB N-terminal domain-containing protein [Tetrasphaera sp.]